VFQEPGALQAVYTDPQTHTWRYWMDRPPLAARNVITLNVPDADAADIEELQKKMGGKPKGGWYKVPFTPSLLDEIAGLQRKDDIPDPPASP
jgi:hypothetical protein